MSSTPLSGALTRGWPSTPGDMIPSKDLAGWLKDLPELKDAANRLDVKRSVAAQASVVEFVLDGLHLSRKINKDRHEGGLPLSRLRHFVSPNYRFSRWDGTQLLSEAADEALLNEFMEDVLARGDIDSSLRTIMRRGAHPRDSDVDVQGMDDMLRKLRAQRQEVLRKHDLGSLLDDLRNKLEEVIQTERQGIEERVAAAKDAVSKFLRRGWTQRRPHGSAERVRGYGSAERGKAQCPARQPRRCRSGTE